MPTQRYTQVSVLGVRLDLTDTATLWQDWDSALRTDRRITITAPHFHILLDAAHDRILRDYLNSCTTNHIDGIGSWAAVRFLHGYTPPRLTGTDTMLPWLERILCEGRRTYVLGGSKATSEALRTLFARKYPDASVRCHHGQISVADAEVLNDITRFQPEVLLVSLGSSFQFAWLRTNREGLEIPVVVATGGFVEFLAGTRPRAPRWMRGAGIEWLHRLVHEPRHLWRRYVLGIPAFLFLLLRERLRGPSPL